jgi:carboxypeptidase T
MRTKGHRGIRGRTGALIALVLVLALATQAAALDDRYHTMNEVRSELKAVAAAHPEITVLDTLGYGEIEGYPIWSLKISDNPGVNEDEPAVLYNGVHHAEEVMGLEVCMWMIDELTSGYGVVDSVTAWIDETEIWFVPLLNPEGHELVLNGTSLLWRKNKADNDESGEFELENDGVDLNNNYDWNWEEGGGPEPGNEYYRGPEAFSEVESRLIRDLTLSEKFVFSLNYHTPNSSVGYYIYYPWYWTYVGFSPDHYTIYDIAQNLAARTLREDDVPFTTQYGYAHAGKARNWQYGAVGTIAYTNEILSQESHPEGERLDGICQRQATGAYYLLDRAKGPGITGHVTDIATGEPIVAEVKVIENSSEQLLPRTTDPVYGRYWRMLTPETYTVEFSADGYLGYTVPVVVGDRAALTVLDAALWPESSGVEDGAISEAPIVRVHPNPCRGSATVSFAAPAGEKAVVDIYSIAGRLVGRSDVTVPATGYGSIAWDGHDLAGVPVASGVYFARLATPAGVDRAKMVYMR